ncbi:hypothetical protein ABZ353_25675 [Streptomyces niveus]|uniref:hypothetical protein n=1 Tax=Streptomyces niveus TaxID=193462 RepID=UPI001331B7CD|nr:hypothetical protein [Streptomyces niveus]
MLSLLVPVFRLAVAFPSALAPEGPPLWRFRFVSLRPSAPVCRLALPFPHALAPQRLPPWRFRF